VAQLARNLKEKKKKMKRKWENKRGGEKTIINKRGDGRSSDDHWDYIDLSAHAHQYRWSSTYCSASGRRVVRLLQLVALQTYSRTDCPPVAADHPTPSETTAVTITWIDYPASNGIVSLIKKKHRRTWLSVAPNKSTIGWLALLVGELRKGFVLVLDGDCTFACNTHWKKLK